MSISNNNKTIAIIGLAPGTKDMAFTNPPGTDMWCLNQGHTSMSKEQLERITAWFQVHPYSEMAERQRPEHNHLEFLRDLKIPVYMEEVHEEIPTSVRYPYEAVCDAIGGAYLTSAVAFMVALAIYQGYGVIKLYGIDMAINTEYYEQRPNLEYLLGLAVGLGIKVWLPPDSPILKGPTYAKTVMVSTATIHSMMLKTAALALTEEDEFLQNEGKLKTLQELLEEYIDEDTTTRGISAKLALQTNDAFERKLHLIADYNFQAGAAMMCQQLLTIALKGDGQTPFDVIQKEDGYLRFAGSLNREFWRQAPKNIPTLLEGFHPENVPPTVSSKHADDAVVKHNKRAMDIDPLAMARWEAMAALTPK